jgi:hypothetical protein
LTNGEEETEIKGAELDETEIEEPEIAEVEIEEPDVNLDDLKNNDVMDELEEVVEDDVDVEELIKEES